jgi:hypothetical protein
MKTILLISALTINGFGYSQNGYLKENAKQLPNKSIIREKDDSESLSNVKQPLSQKISSGTVVWSEDFGNGFPSGWEVDDKSGICPWVYSTDGSWGYYNGNSGTSGTNEINSTTSSNGFLICDADSANNAAYGQPSGTTYKYLETSVITSAIDLSAYPNVIVQFEQFYRFNNAIDLLFSVSTDSVTWTDFNVEDTSSNNIAPDNPVVISKNISSIAGGKSKVYLKFGWEARVYYWMIDDIQIIVPDNNDMEIINPLVITSGGSNFVSIPKNQMQSFFFRGSLFNNGSTDQTNVNLSADVSSDTQSGIFSDALNGGTVGAADTIFIDLVDSFTPGDTGNYYVSYLVYQDSADSEPADNIGYYNFEITDTVYSRDLGAMYPDSISSSEQLGTGSFTGTSDGEWMLATYYPVYSDVIITSMTTHLGSKTESGTSIQGLLMDENFDEILATPIYDLTQSDIDDELFTLQFDVSDPNTELSAGDYLLGIYCVGKQNVFIACDRETYFNDGVSWLYIPNDDWYYLDSDFQKYPVIRMNITDNNVGIKEMKAKEISLEQNIPNPFNHSTQIQYELYESAGNVKIEIYNALGEIVAIYNEGAKNAGKHILNIDATDFSSGNYSYTLISDEKTISRQMIIRK